MLHEQGSFLMQLRINDNNMNDNNDVEEIPKLYFYIFRLRSRAAESLDFWWLKKII